MNKPKSINKTVQVDTEHKREFVMQMISHLPLEPVYAVHVYEDKETRSTAQNALMWVWFTHLSGEGYFSTKMDAHEHYKGEYLVPIYERDDQEYRKTIEVVRDLYRRGLTADALHLRKMIVKLTSTTTASVAQFTEYLKEIENDCNNQNIYLPRKEDQYYLAMGMKYKKAA